MWITIKQLAASLSLLLVATAALAHHHQSPNQHEHHSDCCEAGIYDQDHQQMMAVMHQLELTGDAEWDFVAGMIPHHQGAIDMAKRLLQQSDTPKLVSLANDIVNSQEDELAQLNAWLSANRANPGPEAAHIRMAYQRINERMMSDMAVRASGNPELEFLQAMIPHHVGAVDMAMVLLAFAPDTELADLARAVIQAQNQEISAMQDWLRTDY